LGKLLPQKEADVGNFVPSRDIKTKKIKSLNTIYDLNVGVVEKTANFTVNGKATVKNAAFFEGGAVGAIFVPDGTPAIVGGNGVTVTKLNNGKVQISFTAAAPIGASDISLAMNVTPAGVINGSNKVFTLPNTPSPASSLMLFLNGQLLTAGANADFTLANASITLVTAPVVDDVILALYSHQVSVTSYSINEPLTVTNNGQLFTGTLNSAPDPSSSLMVFMNGKLLTAGASADFTLNNKTVQFSNALQDVASSKFFATYSY